MTNNLLLVDDDRPLLSCIKKGLEKQFSGHEIYTAEDGFQAIEVLKQHTMRLVVTDLIMPRMDGFELLAHMMAHFPDIPVVVTTGHSIPDTQRNAIAKAALSLMLKPIDFKELYATVNRLLEQQSDGGTLNNISPAMFLQLINLEQKTCTIRVTEKGSGKLGVFFFNIGTMLDARAGTLRGEAAAQEIFSWDRISLTIQNSCPAPERKINRTLNALILDAARLKDERMAAATEENEGRLDTICERLKNQAELAGSILSIAPEKRWHNLLAHLFEIGSHLEWGALNSVGISTGHAPDRVVVPAEIPIEIQVDPKCSKEKIYRLLD